MDELTDALRRTLADPRREVLTSDDPVARVHRGIRRRRARRTALAGASLAVVALAAGSALALAPTAGGTAGQPAGGGGGGGSSLVTSPTPTASAAPTNAPSPDTAPPPPAPSPGPAFAADTGEDVGGPQDVGNGLSVVGARIGRQDGFDRVVYELAGSGEVAWQVGYVDEAREQGSGDEIPLDGRSRLAVTIRGVGYPYDTGVPQYDGPRRLRDGSTTTVTEVWLGSVYEGQYDSYVALSGEPRPFRVFSLSNPTRLVVDVRDR